MSRRKPIELIAVFEMCEKHWKQALDAQPIYAIQSWIKLDADVSAPCRVVSCNGKATVKAQGVVILVDCGREMN